MGWFPDFPDPDNFIAPVLRQGQLPQLALPQQHDPRQADPAARQSRALPRPRLRPTIQDIVADDVPLLPLWQGKQYVAAREDVTGVGMGAQLLSIFSCGSWAAA